MKRHALDPVSLVFGVAFAMLGCTFGIVGADSAALRWVWPLPLVVLGTLIIALAMRRILGERDRSRRSSAQRGRNSP